MRRIKLLAPLVLVCAALGSACSSDGPTNQGGGGSITLNLSGTTLSIAQGASGNLTATIARAGDFTGAVAITVTGLAANVTAVANPASIPAGQTTSTIMLTAAANAAAGNTTVTVSASGTGVTTQTRTFTLTITSASAGGFTFALNPTSLSIAQNAQGQTTLTLTRTGGFAGNVTFSQTGAPAGMTVTFNPTSTTGNSSTVTVQVGAAVAAQVHNVTLRGTATGLGDVTINLAVTVTTSGGGGNVTFRPTCAHTMVFAASQDGSNAWTVRTITNNSITFPLPSGRGGVAYVVANSATVSTVHIYYGATADLNTGTITCPAAPTTKTVTGSVANVTNPQEVANIAIGTGFVSVTPLLNPNYTMMNVPDFATNLIAGRILQTIAGQNITAVMNKGIIRRNINPPANSVIPVLDFNASESFTPTTRTATIANLGTDAAGLSVSFLTNSVSQNQAGLGIYTDGLGSNTAARQVPTVPNPQANDIHGYSLFTVPVAGATRALVAYHRDSQDRTLTLGPALGAVTVTTAATAPAPRLRAQYTVQPEYNRGQAVNYTQISGGAGRAYSINVYPNYLAGTTFDITIPELTTLTGWLAAWNLVVGQQITWGFTGTGGTFTGILDGSVGITASRTGSITP